MTTKQARTLGYTISRGDYIGTSDDRADRWYISRDGDIYDRRGPGYRTRTEALQELGRRLNARC
jgi:hypothetical protein